METHIVYAGRVLPKSMVTPSFTALDNLNVPWPPLLIPKGHLCLDKVYMICEASSVFFGNAMHQARKAALASK